MKNILPQFRFMTMIFLFHKLIGHNNIMGSNRGFEQELEVINELNDKFFSDVSPKYKHLMKNIGFNIKNNTKISCQKKEAYPSSSSSRIHSWFDSRCAAPGWALALLSSQSKGSSVSHAS